MGSINNDFVPEGQDAGGLGAGFSDFIPAKEPSKVPVVDVTPVKPAESLVKPPLYVSKKDKAVK